MADIKPRIEAILAGTPYAVTKVAHLWQIRVGHHAGARANGVSLAHDLLAKWRKDGGETAVRQPVTRPEPQEPAAPVERASVRFEEALEGLTGAKVKLDERPRPVPAPPAEIADLLRIHETYEQTNERLLPLYREAKNMAERAIDAGDKTERMKWEAKAARIETAIHWNRGRMIETL